MRGQKLISVIDFKEVQRLLVAVVQQYKSVCGNLKSVAAAMNNAEAKKLRGTLDASAGSLRKIIDQLNAAKEYDEHLRAVIGDVAQADVAADDAVSAEMEIVTDANKFLSELDRISKLRDPIDRVAAYAHLVELLHEAHESAEHRKEKLSEFLVTSKSDKSEGTANQRRNAKSRLSAIESSLSSIHTRERQARKLAEAQKAHIEAKLARAAKPLEKGRRRG